MTAKSHRPSFSVAALIIPAPFTHCDTVLVHALGWASNKGTASIHLPFSIAALIILAPQICCDAGLLHAAGPAGNKGTAILDLPVPVAPLIISSPFTHCDTVLQARPATRAYTFFSLLHRSSSHHHSLVVTLISCMLQAGPATKAQPSPSLPLMKISTPGTW